VQNPPEMPTYHKKPVEMFLQLFGDGECTQADLCVLVRMLRKRVTASQHLVPRTEREKKTLTDFVMRSVAQLVHHRATITAAPAKLLPANIYGLSVRSLTKQLQDEALCFLVKLMTDENTLTPDMLARRVGAFLAKEFDPEKKKDFPPVLSMQSVLEEVNLEFAQLDEERKIAELKLKRSPDSHQFKKTRNDILAKLEASNTVMSGVERVIQEIELECLFGTVVSVREKFMARLRTIAPDSKLSTNARALEGFFSQLDYTGDAEGHVGAAEAMP
jgi:hypothetical protein